MDQNSESLRRKYLAQKPSQPNKPVKIPAGQFGGNTFDRKFRAFTQKIDSRLKDVAISLVFGLPIGWGIITWAVNQQPILGVWWLFGLIWLFTCGLVYWYLQCFRS